MKKNSLLRIFLLLASLLATKASFAATVQVCAVLHEGFLHRGDSRVIFANNNQFTYLGDSWNNVVSSLFVAEGCTVTLYDDILCPTSPYYNYVELDHSVSYLYDFNDKASYFSCTCTEIVEQPPIIP